MSASVNTSEEEYLLKKDIDPVPWRFRNRYSLIVWVAVAFIGCVIAGGPLSGVPTLEEIFVKQGIFQGPNQETKISSLFLVSLGIPVIALFPLGVVYDTFGARWCGYVGALFVSLGYFLCAIALKFVVLEDLLYLGYPWLDICGSVNSFGIYGFTYFFPNNQALIFGLANSSAQISGLIAYVIKFMVDENIPFWLVHLIFGIVILFVIPFLYYGIPGKDHIAYQTAKANDQLTPIETPSALSIFKRVLSAIGKHKVANSLWLLYQIFIYIYAFFYLGTFYYYEISILGTSKGDKISNYFTIIFSAIGFLGSPIVGIICDKIGLRLFLFIQNIILTGQFATIFFEDFTAQLIGIFGISVTYTMFFISLRTWSVAYAGPELFGSFSGFQFTIGGATQLVTTVLIPLILKKFMSITTLSYYLSSYTIPLGIASLLGFALNIWLIRHPPPEKSLK